MAGLYAPLPTLRRRPRGRLRTDRGRRGLLLLHRSGLSPHTPCQSPGALTRVAACTLARSPYFVTRYPKASDISSPPCLLRLLPAGAVAGWGLHHWKAPPCHGAHPFADIRAGVLHRLPIGFLGPRSSGSTSLRFCTYGWACARYSRTSSVREL